MTQPAHDATSQPSAIYVWLVPSEQVLEQPGGWRIRKWDTAPFPEANFTLSPKEDVGPWRIVAESNGATLYSEDFEHDVAITIGGDFADTAQAIAYAENVAKRLSTLPSAIPHTPTKVWVVEGGFYYEGHDVIGVLPTRKAAEEAVRETHGYDKMKATEWTIGEFKP